MKPNALILKPLDNVATCIRDVKRGNQVLYLMDGRLCAITALEDIPCCHKIAIKDIPAGENVTKYAESIGIALITLPAGSWVSHVNIRGIPRDYTNELL